MARLSRSSLLKVLRAWLALELGAGILALTLLVVFLPLAVLAYPVIWGTALPTWALAVTMLTLSVPLGVILGGSAGKIVTEVGRR